MACNSYVLGSRLGVHSKGPWLYWGRRTAKAGSRRLRPHRCDELSSLFLQVSSEGSSVSRALGGPLEATAKPKTLYSPPVLQALLNRRDPLVRVPPRELDAQDFENTVKIRAEVEKRGGKAHASHCGMYSTFEDHLAQCSRKPPRKVHKTLNRGTFGGLLQVEIENRLGDQPYSGISVKHSLLHHSPGPQHINWTREGLFDHAPCLQTCCGCCSEAVSVGYGLLKGWRATVS